MRVSCSMLSSPRCGAKTRSGAPCRSPAVRDKKRCRMHGGAIGSGTPRNNKNALKDGFYTKERIAERREARRQFREIRKLIAARPCDLSAALSEK